MHSFLGQSMFPWAEQKIVSLQGWHLSQVEDVTCEPTPEGGQRCSDGTYLPPGCRKGESDIPGEDPEAFPIVPVAVGVAAAGGAAALLLAGPRRLGVTLEEANPRAYAELRDIASEIRSERSADAYNFKQAIEARRRKQDLIFEIKDAEAEHQRQQELWEATHRNPDALKDAEIALNRLRSEYNAVQERDQDYTARIEVNAQNISTLYNNAMVIINGLPEEVQAEGRRLIEPCFRPEMSGSLPARPLMAGRF